MLALPKLRVDGTPSLISIEGLGGLGKTTLAQYLANEMLAEGIVEAIAWYSVRQSEFHAIYSDVSPRTTELDLKELLFEIQKQLGFRAPGMELESANLEVVLKDLASARFLVVIDNIETKEELVPIVPLLGRVNDALPSKVMVTSRIAIDEWVPGKSFRVPVMELNDLDSINLLRYQGQLGNVEAVTAADDWQLGKIFEVVGGNPLALKLSLGLIRYADLDTIVAELKSAKGKKSDALYHWIYWRSWHALSVDAKRLLIRMRRFGVDGANRRRLEAVSEMDGSQLNHVIEELANMSLLTVVGPIDHRTYAIHRLTRTFLQEIANRWDQDPELARFKEDDDAAARANLAYTRDLLKG
jgi:hypothetical protein